MEIVLNAVTKYCRIDHEGVYNIHIVFVNMTCAKLAFSVVIVCHFGQQPRYSNFRSILRRLKTLHLSISFL